MRTVFTLNDLILNDKRITVTKIVTTSPEKMTADSKFVIRVQKGGCGFKLSYTDPDKVLAKFAELIKTQKVEG